MNFSMLEVMMLICFGFSWPFSIIRSYKSRTSKGKSLIFLILLVLGYISGILHKLLISFDLAIILYIVNMIMISIDIALYARNTKLDKQKSLSEAQERRDSHFS